jgi:hypothetical protein
MPQNELFHLRIVVEVIRTMVALQKPQVFVFVDITGLLEMAYGENHN